MDSENAGRATRRNTGVTTATATEGGARDGEREQGEDGGARNGNAREDVAAAFQAGKMQGQPGRSRHPVGWRGRLREGYSESE